MKTFPDASGNFPLRSQDEVTQGSQPTAPNFNGISQELVNILSPANIPQDPKSGELEGSDGLPLGESNSNKQIIHSIEQLTQRSHLDSIQAQEELIKSVVGQGIVRGLTVEKADLLKVVINTGLAYDGNGHQLMISETLEVDMNDEASDTEKQVLLGLKYTIENPNYVIGDNPPKYLYNVQITPVKGETLPIGAFLLATITINNLGIIDIVNQEKSWTSDFMGKLQNIASEVHIASTKEGTSLDPDFKLQGKYLDLMFQQILINGESIQFVLFKQRFDVGDYYEQDWDIENNDWKPTPLERFGFGTWRQVVTNGEFKRYQGGSAGENRVNGRQEDAMQRLTGSGVVGIPGVIANLWESLDGVLYAINQNVLKPNYSFTGTIVSRPRTLQFDNSRQARTSSENRPTNYPVILWVLESYE